MTPFSTRLDPAVPRARRVSVEALTFPELAAMPVAERDAALAELGFFLARHRDGRLVVRGRRISKGPKCPR